VAKFAPNSTLDGLLEQIALADEMYVTSGQPTSYADLGDSVDILVGPISLTPGDGNGDFTIGDGDVSGRKITISAQNGASVVASGDADHVVLATGGSTDVLRYVTTCTTQTLTSGNTVNVGSWDVEVADPT